MNNAEIEKAEIELVLQAIKARYGWNFIHYKRSSLHRSIRRIISKYNIEHISDLITMIMWNEEFMNTLLCDLSIPVSDMFRDPDFFSVLRYDVIPVLKTYPFIKIWHAGCASGEEVYSLAILLAEENLYDRSRIYATDINNNALEKAREGIFPMSKFSSYENNYRHSGGKEKLLNYFISKYDAIIINANLKKNIFFFDHNLSSDQSFAEMNLILCRNVIIYFDQTLQKKVINLFDESLCYGGFLCLGMKESIDFLKASRDLYLWKKKEKIYRKGIPDVQGEKHDFTIQQT
jgi:chemotaxis protein methyltransferase CheR